MFMVSGGGVGRHLHSPQGSCSPPLFLKPSDGGDVAPTVSLHCFLLLLGDGAPSVSALLLVVIGGTSHPQCLCTASCCYWGDVAPTVSLRCFLLLLGGHGTHSVSSLLLVCFQASGDVGGMADHEAGSLSARRL